MTYSRTSYSATVVLPLGVPSLHIAAAQTVLDPLVITATRTEKELSESPVHTQLVTRESLRHTQSLKLAQEQLTFAVSAECTPAFISGSQTLAFSPWCLCPTKA